MSHYTDGAAVNIRMERDSLRHGSSGSIGAGSTSNLGGSTAGGEGYGRGTGAQGVYHT